MANIANEYRFGDFKLSISRRRLMRDGRPIILSRSSWALLVHLIERQGKFVSWRKLAALMSRRIGKTETIVAREMNTLQESFLLAGDNTHYIVFDARRGYCFAAPIEIKKQRAAKRLVRFPRSKSDLIAVCKLIFTVMGPGIYALILIITIAIFGPIVWRLQHAAPLAFSLQDRRETLVIVPVTVKPSETTNDQETSDATISRFNSDIQRRLDAYTVSTPQAAEAAKARNLSLPDIARRFDAHFIFAGNFQKTSTEATLTVTLINAENGKILWPGKFVLTDLSSVNIDRVVESITQNVETYIDEVEIDASRDRQLDARDWYIQANALLRQTGVNKVPVTRAFQEIHESLAINPNFVFAQRLDCRIRAYMLLYGWSQNPEQDLAKARAELASFKQDEDKDQELAITRALLDLVQGNTDTAEKALAQLALSSRDPLVPLFLGKLRARAGRLIEADNLLRDATILDPRRLSWDIPATHAAIALAQADDSRAVGLAETAIERGTASPENMAEPWLIIASGEAELGNLDAAEPALAIYRSMSNPPKAPETLAGMISSRLAEGLRMVDFAD